MRTLARLTVMALGVAGLAMVAPAANADPNCTGTEEDGRVCVDIDNVPNVDPDAGRVGRCVFLPIDPDCRDISVPVPGTEGGDLYRVVYVD